MSSEINDGGPAFPSSNDIVIGDVGTNGHSGMSLRDYFAAKAMSGMYANSALTERNDFEPSTAALVSYAVADAMLAARETK